MQWLERLQHSANTSGPATGTGRKYNFDFKPSHPETSAEADSGDESGGDGSAEVGIKVEEPQVSDTLDANDSVPIGLLAKMSIGNRRARSKSGSRAGSLAGDSADDDSNVVRIISAIFALTIFGS
jgi:hypothetical protein